MDAEGLLLYELSLLTRKSTEELKQYSVKSNVSISNMKDFFLITKSLPDPSLANEIKVNGVEKVAKFKMKK